MKAKTLFISLATIMTLTIFLWSSYSISDTKAIWIQTRIFGLVSFAALFLTIIMGELRVLTKGMAPLEIFRFHKPLAMFSVFLVLLHGISGMMDNYKWGKGLSFVNYLGFSFSDKWLVLLSFGTLAFYLLVLIGATSQPRMMQVLGYKRWKLVHYLSYAAFFLGYAHAINLGTDLKGAGYAVLLHWLVVGSFIIVLALLLTRIAHAILHFDDLVEVVLASCLFLLLLFGAVIAGILMSSSYERLNALTGQLPELSAQASTAHQGLQMAQAGNSQLQQAIRVVNNG
ncbi:MAG: ferric reductase-like transmembrane domain-containing protein [Candidatus Aenigmarchaeota archaeon]|nr:ferric reductase-like transmembrane domain-containing protein [Candidatus Aenigmarchaeota archaeon]